MWGVRAQKESCTDYVKRGYVTPWVHVQGELGRAKQIQMYPTGREHLHTHRQRGKVAKQNTATRLQSNSKL